MIIASESHDRVARGANQRVPASMQQPFNVQSLQSHATTGMSAEWTVITLCCMDSVLSTGIPNLRRLFISFVTKNLIHAIYL
jgi:hypothetical protein